MKKEIFIRREFGSNRALVREPGEKWSTDVNGEPGPEWERFVSPNDDLEKKTLKLTLFINDFIKNATPQKLIREVLQSSTYLNYTTRPTP